MVSCQIHAFFPFHYLRLHPQIQKSTLRFLSQPRYTMRLCIVLHLHRAALAPAQYRSRKVKVKDLEIHESL